MELAQEAIMRWENEGGALLSAGSPARESLPAHTKMGAVEPRSSGSRAEAVSATKRSVRRPPGAPAT